MRDDAHDAATMRDRRRIRALAVLSATMLAASVAVRILTPSPFAPRVHVRWVEGLSDEHRHRLEKRFGLAAGQRREGTTWEYDLTQLPPPLVQDLVRHNAVADTHYLDRDRGTVAADAPPGTTRLPERRFAGWIHSVVFDWFIAWWLSALVVSTVWLSCTVRADCRA